MRITAGSILWADIPKREPEGREITKSRPCVVISSDALNAIRSTVVIVPLSSAGKVFPPVAIAFPSAGKNSVAIVDQITAIDKTRLRAPQGIANFEDMEQLRQALRDILDL